MENIEQPVIYQRAETEASRSPEVSYQKRFVRAVIIATILVMPVYITLHFMWGYYVQASLFIIWTLNAVIGLFLGFRVQTVQGQLKLRKFFMIPGMALLSGAILHGVIFVDTVSMLPWCFAFSLCMILLFGRRSGFYGAFALLVPVAVVILMGDLSVLGVKNLTMFKLNSLTAWLTVIFWAHFAENTRVRVQKNLVKARNKYQEAEERQRMANTELHHEIQLRTQSEKALAQSEMRYRSLFEESAVSLWEEDFSSVKKYLDELPQEAVDDLFAYFKQNPSEIDKCTQMIEITGVNRATLDLYEADTSETLFRNIKTILPPSGNGYMIERIVSLYLNRRYDAEHPACTLKGRRLHLLISSNIPVGFEDSFQKVFTSVYDVTERVAMDHEKKRVEQQLQQARQMQAVATLAGGIAHQFNNALGVIFGGLDLLEMNATGDPKNRHFFDSLKSSANRMSRLTDQLLAYAHGGKYQPKAFSTNDLIRSIIKANKIIPGPSVNLKTDLSPDIHMVCGDTTQIKMVIEAVLSNAFESMSEGGDVTISTFNKILDERASVNETAIPAGDYTVVRVKDIGTGMDKDTLQRIFEPFFTTKFFGRGLGMAAAYGIITNHDGMIKVSSTPNKGTVVDIFLPAGENSGNLSSKTTEEHHALAS